MDRRFRYCLELKWFGSGIVAGSSRKLGTEQNILGLLLYAQLKRGSWISFRSLEVLSIVYIHNVFSMIPIGRTTTLVNNTLGAWWGEEDHPDSNFGSTTQNCVFWVVPPKLLWFESNSLKALCKLETRTVPQKSRPEIIWKCSFLHSTTRLGYKPGTEMATLRKQVYIQVDHVEFECTVLLIKKKGALQESRKRSLWRPPKRCRNSRRKFIAR